MVSAWWLLAAFVAGGYAGLLVMALMSVIRDDGDDGARLGLRDPAR